MRGKADTINIMDCLYSKYGIAVVTLTTLPLGADLTASVYKAETQEGDSYFVKLKQGYHPDVSVKLLPLLQAAGVRQIILPIQTTDGKLTQSINDFTLIVYPYVEGQNGFMCPLSNDQWIVLGKALKQVHELVLPQSIKNLIRKETYSSKWRDIVRSFDIHMDGDLVGDETALRFQAFMREHRAIIHRLIDRAEALSQVIRKLSAESVLCHSDIHGGNVLIDKNGALYIVDWDEPIMAPKERDLMFIGGGVANTWNIPQEEELFYKGYGKTKINRDILTYYRHERIVQDIAEYGQALLLKSTDGKEKQEMYQQYMEMFEPDGVVDIAFKTDENLL